MEPCASTLTWVARGAAPIFGAAKELRTRARSVSPSISRDKAGKPGIFGEARGARAHEEAEESHRRSCSALESTPILVPRRCGNAPAAFFASWPVSMAERLMPLRPALVPRSAMVQMPVMVPRPATVPRSSGWVVPQLVTPIPLAPSIMPIPRTLPTPPIPSTALSRRPRRGLRTARSRFSRGRRWRYATSSFWSISISVTFSP